MFTKRSKPASTAPVSSQEQSETLDVSKMLDQLESKPIMTQENSYDQEQQSFGAAQDKPAPAAKKHLLPKKEHHLKRG